MTNHHTGKVYKGNGGKAVAFLIFSLDCAELSASFSGCITPGRESAVFVDKILYTVFL